MLTSALLKYYEHARKNGYSGSSSPNDINTSTTLQFIKTYLVIFIIFMLIDLLFVFYALWCAFHSNLPWYVLTILIILMLYPGIGFLVCIGVIVYYHTAVKNKTITKNPQIQTSFF